MRYTFELQKFLHSQHLFSGLRISLGIVLPAVILLFGFDDQALGFTLASGAIAASVVDLPGPLKYKHNEMLACSFLGFLSALATGIASANGLALWLTVVPLTFVLSMIVMFGAKGPQISFATLYMMITNLEQHFTPMEALINALWLLGGSLWYTYWSYLISRWQIERIERQVIADSLFGTAAYLRARARFYDLATQLDGDYNDLVDKQIAAVEQVDAARDIVLRTLPRLKRSDGDPRRTRLFNLFINAVDLHDTAISSHTDYALLRNTFGDADLLLFFHDLLQKSADDLDALGLAILQDKVSEQKIRVKAELRAIEYEIERMRRRNFPARDSEAYSAIIATFRRVWTVSRLIERLHRNTQINGDKVETETRVDQALANFLSRRRISVSQLLTNLTMSSPPFRHALRVTIAVAAGLGLGKLLPITNSYWIVLTTVIILKPGFSLTRQRNTQRIVGTVIGCAASVVFLYLVKSEPIVLIVMFASMFMAYSLLLINYAAAVVFVSAYVLLLYDLMAPSGMRLIGERALDTVIGCAIAVGISYLFANWEYRLMGPVLKSAIAAMRDYMDAVRAASAKALRQSTPAAMAAAEQDLDAALLAGSSLGAAISVTASATVSATADASTYATSNPSPSGQYDATGRQTGDFQDIRDEFAQLDAAADAGPKRTTSASAGSVVVESDYRAGLARKKVHVTYANLGQAFRRMMREPKAQRRYVAELNDLLIQSHVLTSQLTAAAPLIASVGSPEPAAIRHALDAIRQHLSDAEATVNVEIKSTNAKATNAGSGTGSGAGSAAGPRDGAGATSHPRADGSVAADATSPASPSPTPTPSPKSSPLEAEKARASFQALSQALDDMSVAAEKADHTSLEEIHDVKLLAYQCKQMLRSSSLILQDANAIHLPPVDQYNP